MPAIADGDVVAEGGISTAPEIRLALPQGFTVRQANTVEIDPISSRWAVLGGLRFALAMLVAVGHTRMNLAIGGELSTHGIPTAYTGVLGFFLISGYSIASSVERDRKSFLQRRIDRIAPLFLFSVIGSALLIVALGYSVPMPSGQQMEMPDERALLATLVFLNGFAAATPSLFAPLWSISIEVFYYLSALSLDKLADRAIYVLIGLSVLADTLHAEFGRAQFVAENYGVGMVCLAWAWLCGFLVYRRPDSRAVQALTVVLGLQLVGSPAYAFEIAPPVVFVGSAVVLIAADRITVPPRAARFLAYAGELSYPVYMVHWPVLIALARWPWLVHHPWLALPAAIATWGMVALAALHLIDIPLRRRAARNRAAVGAA